MRSRSFLPRSLVAVALAAAVLAPAAFADGDPASDYLISQPVFLPFTAKVSSSSARALVALVDDAKRKGFPLKVAVIGDAYDLGAVPSLFGRPQQYASFLGQEDAYFFRAELLVVMPQGYGLYERGGVPPGDAAAVAALPRPASASGDDLVAAAMDAVRALARRRGLTLSAAGGSLPSQWRDRIVIVAAVAALCALGVGARLVLRRR
jgi:hypothetical protein